MKEISRRLIASGKWLALNELAYLDHKGVERSWECVERRRCDGAVAMIAILKPSRRLVLVRQYRPPANGCVIEFPAGLVDPGENPKEAALREFREETGFEAKLIAMLPPAYNSPGLSPETVRLALLEVNESSHGETKTDFDESESIETLLVPLDALPKFLDEAVQKGDLLDAKVASFATMAKLLATLV